MINRMVGNTGISQVQDAGTVKSKSSCKQVVIISHIQQTCVCVWYLCMVTGAVQLVTFCMF